MVTPSCHSHSLPKYPSPIISVTKTTRALSPVQTPSPNIFYVDQTWVVGLNWTLFAHISNSLGVCPHLIIKRDVIGPDHPLWVTLNSFKVPQILSWIWWVNRGGVGVVKHLLIIEIANLACHDVPRRIKLEEAQTQTLTLTQKEELKLEMGVIEKEEGHFYW